MAVTSPESVHIHRDFKLINFLVCAVVFWPWLGLPRPKAIVVIPKINSCQNHLRKKTSKSAKYPWPLRYKEKRSVEIIMHLGLDI